MKWLLFLIPFLLNAQSPFLFLLFDDNPHFDNAYFDLGKQDSTKDVAGVPGVSTWATVWRGATQTGSSAYDLDATNYNNFRMVIKKAYALDNADSIRVLFNLGGGGYGAATLTSSWIDGRATTTSSYSGTPVQILFSGSGTTEMSGDKWSDKLAFTFDSTGVADKLLHIKVGETEFNAGYHTTNPVGVNTYLSTSSTNYGDQTTYTGGGGNTYLYNIKTIEGHTGTTVGTPAVVSELIDTFYVYNNSGVSITISSMALSDGGHFTLSGTTGAVTNGSSARVILTFDRDVIPGDYHDSLLIHHYKALTPDIVLITITIIK